VQGKVCACKKHENRNNPLDKSAFVIGNACIFGTEASCGHGGKTMTDSVEKWHAT